MLLQAVRIFLTKSAKYDRPFEATILYRKIVLGAVNSTLYDKDCNEAKIKDRFLQVKNCSKCCVENKRAKIFQQQIFHTNNNSQGRTEFSKLAYRFWDGIYCKCEKRDFVHSVNFTCLQVC